MELPLGTISESHFGMGVFALFVVVVSLCRIMSDEEFFRLTAMKKLWGRRQGLVTYFVSNVALPMVVGIVFITRGIAGFGGSENRLSYDVVAHNHVMNHILTSYPVTATVDHQASYNHQAYDYWAKEHHEPAHTEFAKIEDLSVKGLFVLPHHLLP